MLQSRFLPIPTARNPSRSGSAAEHNAGSDSSNYQIAELLMDIKRIAGDEMMRMKDPEGIVASKKKQTRSSSHHHLKPASLTPTRATISPTMVKMMMPPTTKLRSRPSILAPKQGRNSTVSINIPSSPRINPRSRLVSLDYGDVLAASPTCVTPDTGPRLATTIGIGALALDSACYLVLPQDMKKPNLIKMSSNATSTSVTVPSSAAAIAPDGEEDNNYNSSQQQQQPKKKKNAVGRTLHDGVVYKGTLRKKFSWKSFPELETYLIDHRAQYLEYSASLNYTKAQKIYNNKLTQGLLDLAAAEGYTFEGFSFAAVRDRIRCFYKSYVQATKKKKRGISTANHHNNKRSS
jgi:hypothetical protein